MIATAEDDLPTPTVSQHSTSDDEPYINNKPRRYLLHDVNMGEGLNLRRDVYMRVANVVRQLRDKGHNWSMVLPPPGGIYHWQSKLIEPQVRLPWHLFYLDSSNRFVTVIEFEDMKETGSRLIDHVFYLQQYAEGWQGGRFEEKWHYRPCIDSRYYNLEQADQGIIHGWFFGYETSFTAKRFDCISLHGQASILVPLLTASDNTARSLMIDRTEVMLHD